MSVTVPPLPTGLRDGQVVLTADNGYGKTVTARLPIRSFLNWWVEPSLPSYGGGEVGEVVLTVRNQGTLLEEGQVTGGIEGIAMLPATSYSVCFLGRRRASVSPSRFR